MPTKQNSIEMLLIFAAIDAFIEEELKKELKKEKKYNLVGRKYTVQDNSYIREIVDGEKKSYHCGLCGETVIIISQPYITMVEGALKPHEQRMIKVKSMKTGFIYEVLFNEGWIQ